jgi:glycosyltransferase involved in cell wall biosynthesis
VNDVETPLSFCMVTTFYPPYNFGGDGMFIYHLVNELARRGHRVTVAHCLDAFQTLAKAPPAGNFPQHPNVRVHSLESWAGRLSPIATYLSGRPVFKAGELKEILAADHFDVIHFHQITLLGPGVLELKGSDAIRLYTMHDHWLLCPMYDLWKYNREVCERPACLRCTLSFRRPPQLWRSSGLLERALDHVDLFLAPSESVMREHARRGFTRPMRHLPHFVPLDEATPSSSTLSPEGARDRPYFLFVGRLVKLKGVHTLIEAFLSYDKADLVIAGDGADADELTRMAKGLEHVRFLGHVPPDRLRALYAGAQAVLVPSLAYETFGFVTLEALAQGTPVIATSKGAVGELVRSTGGGITYSNQEELVAAMERFRNDPSVRDQLGARGHRMFVEHWSEAPHLDRYFELIREAGALRDT